MDKGFAQVLVNELLGIHVPDSCPAVQMLLIFRTCLPFSSQFKTVFVEWFFRW